MLDQRRVAAQPDEKREQLFTERYAGLLAWALRLTNQQRETAEDLVQDAFVQFVLGRTKLEEIENIDGYLRRMLRYMHLSRMSRSAQHLQDAALSIADYDSLRLGLTAIEPPRRMQASEELRQICAYACLRKESSRAGSVLILRFFHDYFPTEIAGILNSSRHCVDEWQRLARREAKLFMNEPGRLRFVDVKTPTEPRRLSHLRSDCDLMFELRRIIFSSRQGECLSAEELEKLYANGQSETLATTKLAHVVSCPSCLDGVNRLLGLPLLAERYQAEPTETKEPPRDDAGGGASGGGAGELTQKLGRRLRETHQHKPQELRIAVNGFQVSSLKVSSELSALDLNLTPDDAVEFVEICSEQGVQLLFFSINATEDQQEQWAWIELSDGRSLEACFRNDNGPSLRVIYKDPAPAEALNAVEALNAQNLSSPLFVVRGADDMAASAPRSLDVRTWLRRIFDGLTLRGSRRVLEEREALAKPESSVESLDQTTPLRTLLRQATNRRPVWRHPGVLTMLLSLIVVAGLLFFKASLAPSLTATSLLEKATVAEKSARGAPDRIRHSSLNLEERRSTEGAVVARHRIESWENNSSGARAQRLYDDSNRLVAGAWQKVDGARIVYHHGSKPRSQAAITTPDSLLLNLDEIWQLQPSAELFSALVADPAGMEFEERSTTYVLRYERERTIGASRLLKATLTIGKSDLHPIEQTLLVQRGSELREYRFVEASFEVLPSKPVAPAVFEIEPELTGGAGEPGRPGDWALRDLTSSRVPPSPSTSAPPPASAELEVDVAYLLNQAKADRNEQVALTRSAGGSLRVEGVVENEERKDQFLKALAPVSDNPAVKIEIRTIAEAMKRPASGTPVSVQQSEDAPDTVAADAELRAFFSKRDPHGPVDEAVRNYSSQVVNGAYRALFHAIELKRLVNRFAGVDMRTVAPDARVKWLAMLADHASSFQRENAALRHQVQPLFFAGSSAPASEDATIQSDAELARDIERLYKIALFNNEAIRSAFTISAQSSANAVKSGQFWQSLQRAESLAERIKEYRTTSN